MFKKHTIITVGDKGVGYAFGFGKKETCIVRTTSCYDGQQPLEKDSLAKVGLVVEEPLYPFAKIESKQTSMSTAKQSAYSIVTGEDEFKVLYTAEKLSSMNFYCVVRTADGTPVVKGGHTGITFYSTVSVSEGVDLIAAVLAAQSTMSPDGAGTAGALAGAGVI